MPEYRNHTRSVYVEDNAAEFMGWLNNLWGKLTDTEKASAIVVARQSVGMVMVGIEYRVDSAVTNGVRGSGS